MDPFILHSTSLSLTVMHWSQFLSRPGRWWSCVQGCTASWARLVTLRGSWAATHNTALPCLCTSILSACSSTGRLRRHLSTRCCSLKKTATVTRVCLPVKYEIAWVSIPIRNTLVAFLVHWRFDSSVNYLSIFWRTVGP